MKRVIHRLIRTQRDGLQVAGDVDAVIAVNSGEDSQTTSSHSRSSVRIVQRRGADAGETGRKATDDKEEE